MKKELCREWLRNSLDYNPETGEFRWKVSYSNRVKAGDIAGSVCKDRGYIRIQTPIGQVYAHRLAWFYVYGEWPPKDTDHRNRIKSDNRLDNLRPGNRSFNMQNIAEPKSNNSTGFLGVHRDKKKFGASITVNYKRIHLGNYDTPEEAHEAYVAAKRKLHEGNTL